MEYLFNFFTPNYKQSLYELCSNPRRLDITKKLLDYIIEHKLQDENDVNSIVLNNTLATYFNCEVGQKLTYYEIQQLIQLDKPFDILDLGFKTPYTLSDDLCKFLEMEKSSKLSRLDVTKRLCEYIKSYDLQDENNNRIVVLDENLANLFNLSVGKLVTFYEIQYSLQNHIER